MRPEKRTIDEEEQRRKQTDQRTEQYDDQGAARQGERVQIDAEVRREAAEQMKTTVENRVSDDLKVDGRRLEGEASRYPLEKKIRREFAQRSNEDEENVSVVTDPNPDADQNEKTQGDEEKQRADQHGDLTNRHHGRGEELAKPSAFRASRNDVLPFSRRIEKVSRRRKRTSSDEEEELVDTLTIRFCLF